MRGTLTLFRSERVIRLALPPALSALLALGPLAAVAAVSVARHVNNKKASAVSPLVPGIRTIALFATSNEGGASGGDVAASAFDTALKMRLNVSGGYQATSFNTRLPAIQRAITESVGGANSLTSADIKTPVTDAGSARKIAAVMATDGFMMDEVDSCKQDPGTHAVTVTVSGSLYSTATGAAARTFAVTGAAAPEIAGEDDSAVTQRAVGSAAAQIVSTLGVESREKEASTLPNSSRHRSGVGGSILLIALAGLLIGVLASNLNSRGGHTGGGGTDTTTTGGASGTSTSSSTSTTGPPAPPSTTS